MMTGPKNWRMAYPAFLLLILAVGVVNYFVLKRLEAKKRKKAEKESDGIGQIARI